jgi:glycine oxidase
MKEFEYLVVGQGIAGSVMSLELLKRGKKILVIDEPALSSSSKIAAGVYNPFNFKWRLNNWRANEVTPLAIEFYDEAEKFCEAKFHHRKRLLKIFSDDKERELWLKEANKKKLFAEPFTVENEFPEILSAPFGIGVVAEAGNVDTLGFLNAVRAKLIANDLYRGEKFDYEKIAVGADGVVYDGKYEAKKIICCEGILALREKYFSVLPLRPVKGEVLHVRIDNFPINDVINRGVYLLPVGNDRFICGATYAEEGNEEITEKAREELLAKLKKFILAPIEVENQFAGIRPAVIDRRPLAGSHPDFPQLVLFNGFGSKAVLLAPWLAEKLIDHLETGVELPAEVDLTRFVVRGSGDSSIGTS